MFLFSLQKLSKKCLWVLGYALVFIALPVHAETDQPCDTIAAASAEMWIDPDYAATLTVPKDGSLALPFASIDEALSARTTELQSLCLVVSDSAVTTISSANNITDLHIEGGFVVNAERTSVSQNTSASTSRLYLNSNRYLTGGSGELVFKNVDLHFKNATTPVATQLVLGTSAKFEKSKLTFYDTFSLVFDFDSTHAHVFTVTDNEILFKFDEMELSTTEDTPTIFITSTGDSPNTANQLRFNNNSLDMLWQQTSSHGLTYIAVEPAGTHFAELTFDNNTFTHQVASLDMLSSLTGLRVQIPDDTNTSQNIHITKNQFSLAPKSLDTAAMNGVVFINQLSILPETPTTTVEILANSFRLNGADSGLTGENALSCFSLTGSQPFEFTNNLCHIDAAPGTAHGVMLSQNFSAQHSFLHNTFVLTNMTQNSYALLADQDVGLIAFNIFYQDSAAQIQGGLLFTSPTATPVVSHNIFQDASQDGDLSYIEQKVATGSCLIVSAESATSGCLGTYESNMFLTTESLFVNLAQGDFSLQSTSLAMDAALTSTTATDILGATRPSGDAADMGAYELVQSLFCQDNDDDGTTSAVCENFASLSQAEAAGYTTPTELQDCDDKTSSVNPQVTEVCSNSVDDNCDGSVDENCNVTETPNDAAAVESAGGCVLSALQPVRPQDNSWLLWLVGCFLLVTVRLTARFQASAASKT